MSTLTTYRLNAPSNEIIVKQAKCTKGFGETAISTTQNCHSRERGNGKVGKTEIFGRHPDVDFTVNLRRILWVSAHCCLLDHAGVRRWLAFWQCVDMFHTADHITPCGILVVKEARVVEADEELAVRAVRAAGARH